MRVNGYVRAAQITRIFIKAVFDKECRKPAVSHLRLLRLKLRKSFNEASQSAEIFSRAQFIFFGDTNHTDMRIHRFFYSPKNIKRMADAGIKHVFPEVNPIFQDLVDEVSSRRITPEVFAARFLEKT